MIEAPLLDRDLFFGDPEYSAAQISPNGRFVSFIKPFKGMRNIWVKEIDQALEEARPITADEKRPIPSSFWSRDSRFIIFVQDHLGDENFHVYAVEANAAPPAGSQVPQARNLTEGVGARAQIYQVSKINPELIWVGLNDRDPAWHDLYRLNLSTGERTLIRKNTARIARWIFDLKDQLRLAVRSSECGEIEVLRIDQDGFTRIYQCDVLETCRVLRLHPDEQRVYMVTNRGERDLSRLCLVDVANGEEEFVESDPKGRVDFGQAIFSEATDNLVGTAYVDERVRFHWQDKTFQANYSWLRSQLPGVDVYPGTSSADEQKWLVIGHSDLEPGVTYLADFQAKTLLFQFRIKEKLPREALCSVQAITYRSSDGLEIPAYLTLPKGVEAKNLPLVVMPHGGPWHRDTWGYRSWSQFLANRGYVVLQPNFRGSTGYGKRFLNGGNLEWGQKMQDDLTWGVKHLVAQGLADPERVGIMGGSYGGYATLAGVTFTPDLYSAAVAIVAPSHLISFLETMPRYWATERAHFLQRVGNPNTPEGKAQLERQSPLNSVHKIQTPLMVVHGANDPRVKKAESDQIVIALRDRGLPVEYLVAEDEGHGFSQPVNNLAMFAAVERFFATHLGGRFQSEISPEVAERLKAITVDLETVGVERQDDERQEVSKHLENPRKLRGGGL